MSDEGYTWWDHARVAYLEIGISYEVGERDLPAVRRSLFAARASLTRALLLLPAPEDKDAA